MHFRAAVMHEANAPLTIETVELKPLQPGDALVRIRAAGMCHTDLEVVERQLAYPMPIVLGHEAAGTVEALGRRSGRRRGLARATGSCCRGTRIAVTASTASRTSRSCANATAPGPRAAQFDGTPRLGLPEHGERP